MSVMIAYLAQGTLMGDFEEIDTGTGEKSWKCEKPVFVSVQPNNVQLFPFLAVTTSDSVVIKENELRFGGLFEPAPELRNHYSSQFGSGIQIRP